MIERRGAGSRGFRVADRARFGGFAERAARTLLATFLSNE